MLLRVFGVAGIGAGDRGGEVKSDRDGCAASQERADGSSMVDECCRVVVRL